MDTVSSAIPMVLGANGRYPLYRFHFDRKQKREVSRNLRGKYNKILDIESNPHMSTYWLDLLNSFDLTEDVDWSGKRIRAMVLLFEEVVSDDELTLPKGVKTMIYSSLKAIRKQNANQFNKSRMKLMVNMKKGK